MRLGDLLAVGSLFGMRIQQSPHATGEPQGKPQTDDMRAMVDHFRTLGLIRRVPAAYKMGDIIVMHPVLYQKLRSQLTAGSPGAWRAPF